MADEKMRRFWDARAREDARYFINNQLAYRRSGAEEFWASGEHDLDALLRETGSELRADDSVVEIGCGIGRMTRAIAARAAQVIAIDVSAEMIERARVENPQLDTVDWHAGDGSSLDPIADGSATAVISHVVFQHLPDPALTLGYIREIGRVLAPGGWAAFQVSNDPGLHAGIKRSLRQRALWRLKVLAGRAPKGQSNPAWLGSAVDLDELRRVAAESRLEVERIVGEGTQFCFVRLVRPSPAI